MRQRDSVPVLITGQLFFKKPVDIQALRGVVRERLMTIPRFCCVVYDGENKAMMMRGVEPAEMDMEYHVTTVEKSTGGKWAAIDVDIFCSEMYSQEGNYKLDYKQPAWRFFVFAMEDGRTLVLPCLDHHIVDGVAAVAALLSLLDKPEKEIIQKPKTKRTSGPAIPVAGKALAFIAGVGEALLGPVLPSDTKSALKEPDHRFPSMHKACVAGGKVSLDEMKRIKEKFPGATINDIMLATLTLTMQRYYKELGEAMIDFRGNFPMNLRDPKLDVLKTSVGNRFIGCNFAFPLREADPVKMVWSIKRQVDCIKCSPGPLILDKLLCYVIPFLTMHGLRSQLLDLLLDTYGKVTVMLSNVPGPSSEVSLCGQPLDDMMFYAFAPIGCYLGILSYGNSVSLGIVCSSKTEPKPSRISSHWVPAFEQLVDAVDAAPPEAFKAPRYVSDSIALGVMVLGAAFTVKWVVGKSSE